MIFLCQHFRGHIARSSARVSFILRLELASDAHISDMEIPTGVQDEILRLDIPVDDALVMHMLKAKNQASDQKLALSFSKGVAL